MDNLLCNYNKHTNQVFIAVKTSIGVQQLDSTSNAQKHTALSVIKNSRTHIFLHLEKLHEKRVGSANIINAHNI